VAELHHVGASAQGRCCELDDACRLGVRGDEVKPSGAEPLPPLVLIRPS